jgi:hypothetical protein
MYSLPILSLIAISTADHLPVRLIREPVVEGAGEKALILSVPRHSAIRDRGLQRHDGVFWGRSSSRIYNLCVFVSDSTTFPLTILFPEGFSGQIGPFGAQNEIAARDIGPWRDFGDVLMRDVYRPTCG